MRTKEVLFSLEGSEGGDGDERAVIAAIDAVFGAA